MARAGTATLVEAYAYDNAGRRLTKTTGATTTAYLYDNDAILGEWSGSVAGTPAAVYAQGGTDDPLMRLTGNSGGTDAVTLAYLADGLGSIQAAAGNMITGGPVAATSITPTNSYNEAAYPSAKVIDGETTGSSGFWAGTANTTTPSMLTLELGSSQTLSRVKLHRVASYLADYTVKAADVQLRQADNSWLTVGTLTGNTTADSPEIAFPPAASSAVRVIFKGARVGTLVLVACTDRKDR